MLTGRVGEAETLKFSIEESTTDNGRNILRFFLSKIYTEVEIMNDGRNGFTKRQRVLNKVSDLVKKI